MYSGLDKEFKALKRNYKALVFHMFDRSSIRHPAVLIPSEQLLMTVPIKSCAALTIFQSGITALEHWGKLETF